MGDAAIHVFMLGFVMGMVMAHAPTVIGAVIGSTLGQSPLLYVHLGLLHVSVATRRAGGLIGSPALIIAGAIGASIAIALFVAATIVPAFRR